MKYKHKQTGEIITVSNIRININDVTLETWESDANNSNVNLSRDYEMVADENDETPTNFSAVRAKAAAKDGGKLR